ncbi:MAG TPA: hemerythrin domain-containing protein [Azospirillaceae bacterium]|nr:hemerythrin domain-containing protein [Azospirillaceae bacterium]
MATGTKWLSMRGLAAFASGAVAAIIVSRILPPLVAQATGAARAVAGRDPFDALAQDHRQILFLLNEMERSPNDAVFHRTQHLLRLKRRLTAHALAEEDVIYPLLHDQAHEIDDTKRLYGEHAEMKMLLFALEQIPKDDPRWLNRVGDLKALIAEHVYQEENIDFPKLRQLLGRQAIVRLSGSVQREKAFVL